MEKIPNEEIDSEAEYGSLVFDLIVRMADGGTKKSLVFWIPGWNFTLKKSLLLMSIDSRECGSTFLLEARATLAKGRQRGKGRRKKKSRDEC